MSVRMRAELLSHVFGARVLPRYVHRYLVLPVLAARHCSRTRAGRALTRQRELV